MLFSYCLACLLLTTGFWYLNICLLSFEILYSTCERLILSPVSTWRQTGSKPASKIMPIFQQLTSTLPILYLTFRWATGVASSSQCLLTPSSMSHPGLSDAITQIKLQSVRWFQLLLLLLFFLRKDNCNREKQMTIGPTFATNMI